MSTRQDAPAAIPWPGAGAVTGGPDEQAVTGQLRAQVAAALARHAQDRDETGQGALPPGERHAVVSALISQALEEHATAALRSGQPALDPAAEKRITRAVTDALLGLGGLQALLDDPQVENIDVNGHDQVFVGYADGRIARAAPAAASDAELAELIRMIAARAGTEERRFDRASPRLTIQLPDGSRLFAVMSVTRRPCISVRRHRHAQVTLDGLARSWARSTTRWPSSCPPRSGPARTSWWPAAPASARPPCCAPWPLRSPRTSGW